MLPLIPFIRVEYAQVPAGAPGVRAERAQELLAEALREAEAAGIALADRAIAPAARRDRSR